MLGGGLMVSDAELLLVNVVPVVVLPATETRYGVGDATEKEPGTTNVTRRVVPDTVTTLDAAVDTVGPAPADTG